MPHLSGVAKSSQVSREYLLHFYLSLPSPTPHVPSPTCSQVHNLFPYNYYLYMCIYIHHIFELILCCPSVHVFRADTWNWIYQGVFVPGENSLPFSQKASAVCSSSSRVGPSQC